MCENWGFTRSPTHVRKESIDEMKHADALVERILFLEGLPEPPAPRQAQHRPDGARAAARATSPSRRARQAPQHGDRALPRARATTAARTLLTEILVSEEEHVDWLETPASAARRDSSAREPPYLADVRALSSGGGSKSAVPSSVARAPRALTEAKIGRVPGRGRERARGHAEDSGRRRSAQHAHHARDDAARRPGTRSTRRATAAGRRARRHAARTTSCSPICAWAASTASTCCAP